MLRCSLLLTFTLFAVSIALGQSRMAVERCGFVQQMEDQLSTQEGRDAYQYFQDASDWWPWANNVSRSNDSLLVVPVVVHVLYRSEAQNISEAQIQSQIDVLNEDFNRQNADTGLTPSPFDTLAANCRIQFCRATLDPDSNPTTGITRTATTVPAIGNTTQYFETALGGHDAWPRDHYLNIWVCELNGILGFASPPGSAPESDGVVIGYQNFGRIGTATAPYHKGRTATHEVGHWLNLLHVAGDDNGMCNGSDNVDDTPNQESDYGGCPTHPQSSCGSLDMFMNFMDLVNDSCMNLFSEGQKERMRNALLGPRASIVTSHGCDGEWWPSLQAGIRASAREVTEGQSIDFFDESNGQSVSWQWSFEGADPPLSFQVNPSVITYPDSGTWDVTLVISDAVIFDTLRLEDYITVKPVQPCDTLNFPLVGTRDLYVSPNGGFVSGNNGYFDKAKANFYDTHAPYSAITGVGIHFAVAHDATGSSQATINIWDNDGPAGEPGSILQSVSVAMDDLAQDVDNGDISWIPFANDFLIAGDFYVGVALDSTNADSLAIWTNTDGDVGNGIAWEKWSNDTWRPYFDSWGISIANAIYPVACGPIPIGQQEQPAAHDITLFPNPAGNSLNIRWRHKTQAATLEILTLSGNRIETRQLTGNSTTTLPLDHYSNGVYLARIKTASGVSVHRFAVAK